MKRILSMFMICLALINFSACTKSMTTSPNGGNSNAGGNQGVGGGNDDVLEEDIDTRKLNLFYIDLNANPTDMRTDTMMMNLKEGADGFYLLSKKSEDNEYTTQLIETNSGIVISMMYKNNSKFPHKITVSDGKDVAVGTTTKHRLDTEDYDILWGSGDDTEVTTKIPLSKDIYNYMDDSQFDAIGNYQLNTMLISFQIWTSFNDYIKDQPVAFGFWKKFFKVFLAVVAIVVAVFIPPVAVALAPFIGAGVAAISSFVVLGASAAGIMTVSNAIDLGNNEDTKGEIDTRRKILNINNFHSPSHFIKDGEVFLIEKKVNYIPKEKLSLIIPKEPKGLKLKMEVPELGIKKFSIEMRATGDRKNPIGMINDCFNFYAYKQGLSWTTNQYILSSNNVFYTEQLLTTGEHYFIIEKVGDLPPDLGDVIVSFKIGDDNVIFNDAVLNESSFKIIIK